MPANRREKAMPEPFISIMITQSKESGDQYADAQIAMGNLSDGSSPMEVHAQIPVTDVFVPYSFEHDDICRASMITTAVAIDLAKMVHGLRAQIEAMGDDVSQVKIADRWHFS
jgi:hypothetical protein